MNPPIILGGTWASFRKDYRLCQKLIDPNGWIPSVDWGGREVEIDLWSVTPHIAHSESSHTDLLFAALKSFPDILLMFYNLCGLLFPDWSHTRLSGFCILSQISKLAGIIY